MENVELHTVFGGDWIADIGASVGNAWCAIKGAWNEGNKARYAGSHPGGGASCY